MRRQADIAGRPPEERKHKVRKAAGDLLRGSRGTRGHPHHGFDGTFAGNLQGKIRQWASWGRMFMVVIGKGPWGHAWRATQGTIGRRSNTEGSSPNAVGR